MQRPVAQSAALLHVLPIAQRITRAATVDRGLGSVLNSVRAGWHLADERVGTCRSRSLSLRRTRPVAQGGQLPPPQSTSVSLPSLTMFAHIALTERRAPL